MIAGQSHDGYFEFSRNGQVKHVLGSAKVLSEKGVVTKDGTVYPADMVVFCGGCEYQGSPPFLANLKLGEEPANSNHTLQLQRAVCAVSLSKLSHEAAGQFYGMVKHKCNSKAQWYRKSALKRAGFEDLHSFAFIGSSGRIGTASDGLFSYVPAGPNKQIDMFLHAYDLRKEGRLAVRALSLNP